MSASIPPRIENTPLQRGEDLTAVMPDFPFDYAKFLSAAKAASTSAFIIDDWKPFTRVGVVGGGISGLVAAYELLRAGLLPVIIEAGPEVGGRMRSEQLPNGAIAELGAMRFPPTCKTLFHYFDKAGMTGRMAPFPNPATDASPGTRVSYKGVTDYFDVTNPDFPLPQKYKALSEKWNKLMDTAPYSLSKMQEYLKDPEKNEQNIKSAWNKLITEAHDNKSFHQALVDANWTYEEIELFGQVGFGSGGWNTNYVNCFLEVLRVAYTAMESDHMLCYDGVQTLPKALYKQSPSDFGDEVSHGSKHETVMATTVAGLMLQGLSPNNLVVRDIEYDATDRNTPVTLGVYSGNKRTALKFAAVIFTPHVRQLQMMSTTAEGAASTRKLLSEEMWEAIEYTHYMQSAKTFVAATEAFWDKKDALGRHVMSTTLSDRLTRGTYLLDYIVDEQRDVHGAAVCLTYTWNDDALKFLPFEAKDRASRALAVLKGIYPDIPFDSLIKGDPKTISWEREPFYIGAFKNNLPGHYRYQRRLYSQFAEPETPAQSRFVLAGDDVSWTGGWAEGAITTGLNAAHAVVKALGGRAFNNRGPLDRWNDLKPKVL